MSLKRRAIVGVRWTAFTALGRRLAAFFVSVVLARLIDVEDFGIVAMAMVFVGVVDLFRDLGTGTAIVQKQVISQELLSSIFWFNLAFGLLASISMFALAGAVATFYAQPRVGAVLQLLSAGFVLSGASVIHASLLTRDMHFGRLAAVEWASVLSGAATAVLLAYLGFGVWSLVWQSLITHATNCALLWTVSRWRPTVLFRVKAFREILNYSLNLTAFNFINYFARTADNALVGRYLGAQSLGYYDLAYRIFLMPLQLLSWVVMRVMFPVYAKLQTDDAAFRTAYTRANRAIAFISFPAMLGLVAVPDLFIVTLFGEAWRPAAPLLAILAPLGALQSIGTTVGSIYQAKGRTDVLFRWSLVVTPFIVCSFAIGLPWGVVGVASSYAIVAGLLQFPTFYVAFRLIKLSMLDFAQSIFPALACATAMLLVVLAVRGYFVSNFRTPMSLGLLVLLGGTVYLVLTGIFNRSGIADVMLILGKRSG
jgi:O-antigen/teichoic acid export membrane protein